MARQVLIMNPTRELAVQTQKVIMAIGDFMQVILESIAELISESMIESIAE